MTASNSRGLSDHDYMRDVRLPSWGSWGRWDTDKPNCQRLGGSIYQMGRADRQGEGESLLEQDDLPPKMDIADCELLDHYIRQLGELHRAIIRQKFYKRLPVHRLDVDAAVRALLDLMGRA